MTSAATVRGRTRCMSMADGVVGRGVLLDVPRALGRDYFDTGEVVTVADLEAAEEAAGRDGGTRGHPPRRLGS